ncbi:MAG: hypothetical protein COA90_07635 [Gammaproteobacteria bacterium]|nr:MAG: hypothetical protein COA90_07635 [Gammaproteobacteria bacterium]
MQLENGEKMNFNTKKILTVAVFSTLTCVANAQPVDSDRDEIVDSRDNCPRTSVEIIVNNQGCPVLETTMMEQTLEVEVEFDTNKAEIKPEYNTTIKFFAGFMKLYPDSKAIIEGHTDSMGSVVNNLSLSKRRAMALVNELVNVYGINIARLTAAGLGELSPIRPNNTAAGRSQNRRIKAHISIEVKEKQMR